MKNRTELTHTMICFERSHKESLARNILPPIAVILMFHYEETIPIHCKGFLVFKSSQVKGHFFPKTVSLNCSGTIDTEAGKSLLWILSDALFDV